MIEGTKLLNLGYQVGVAKGKSLVGLYFSAEDIKRHEADGISIVLDDIVCVDFDTHLHMDVGWGNELPYTWKEKSPRGYHLFYKLPYEALSMRAPKVKWKKDVDLLTQGKTMYTPYGPREMAAAHVLVAPSFGYKRMYPDEAPHKDQLPMAPNWLLEAIKP